VREREREREMSETKKEKKGNLDEREDRSQR
jgi:hypothetical protein